MARGTVVWRCWICSTATAKATCVHSGAKYYIGYRLAGKQKWEPIGRNRKDAEHRLAGVMKELQQGTFRLLKPIVFREFSEQWLRDYAEGVVKPLTLRFYRIAVRTYLNPVFGQFLLTQINAQTIQAFVARCRRESNLSAKSTRSLFTVLKMLLKQARRWGYLRENPAEGIKPPKLEEKEMDFLHPKEIRLLLQNADEPYRTLFLTAILTGMRRGELLGLQWGDIDWHNSRIRVRRTLYCHTKAELAEHGKGQIEKWQFSTPKSSKSIRTIVMSPRLKDALGLHRLTCPRSSLDLVFCTKEGGPIQAENMVKREFLPALARAGLRRVRFHDLRHTYATLLIAQGENAKFIQSQLGHASIETTMDRYGHLLPEAYHRVGEKLDVLIFGTGEASSDSILIADQAQTR